MKLEWLGHAGFKISGSKIIYIDPFQCEATDKADIVLITHPHYDHCSINDLKKIVKLDTVIVAPIGCQSKVAAGKMHFAEFKNVVPSEKLSVYGCHIVTVPAYNVGKNFHSKNEEWVGFIIQLDGTSFYHAGDTDYIQEMVPIKADIALLPIGGTYTMNAREAAQATVMMRPKIAIPMHYGSIVGSADDADVFMRSVAHSKVQVMQVGSPVYID